MSRPQEQTFTPSAADLDYFVDNGAGAGPFTLLATSAPDGLAHRVSIKENSSQDQSGKTFTVVGTDANGRAISETITGPGSTLTVESTLYFKSVTSVTPSATLGANTVDVGFVDEFVSKTFYQESKVDKAAQVDITGTIDYTVQETLDQVLVKGAIIAWLSTLAALTGQTADAMGSISPGVQGVRVVANSYSTGATLRIVIRPSMESGVVSAGGGGGGGYFP